MPLGLAVLSFACSCISYSATFWFIGYHVHYFSIDPHIQCIPQTLSMFCDWVHISLYLFMAISAHVGQIVFYPRRRCCTLSLLWIDSMLVVILNICIYAVRLSFLYPCFHDGLILKHDSGHMYQYIWDGNQLNAYPIFLGTPDPSLNCSSIDVSTICPTRGPLLEFHIPVISKCLPSTHEGVNYLESYLAPLVSTTTLQSNLGRALDGFLLGFMLLSCLGVWQGKTRPSIGFPNHHDRMKTS